MDRKILGRDIAWVFDVALVLKLINGAFEIAGAALILLVRPMFVLRIAEFVTSGELSTDPDDFIANSIRAAAHSFAIHTHYFIALYLVFHGAVKVLLVIGIFAGKKIAYPLFVIALALFCAYETYLGISHHTILLDLLALFDFILILLTMYEYRRRYGTTLGLGKQ